MNIIPSRNNWGSVLWVLIFAQILCCLYITGSYLIKSSNLIIWTDKKMSRSQKMDLILGGDYPVSEQFSWIPKDAGILAVASDTIFFCNYYFLPRPMYTYNNITKDEDLRVPKDWLKKEKISYLFLYHIPRLKVMTVNKNWDFE
jgi:hypothetical protein